MNSFAMIAIIGGIILILLFISLPGKLLKWTGQAVMKILIGALFLFFLNAVGNQFGVFVPINFVTSSISGFLGLPGVAALTIIQLYILV
ncbi:pro-sigmaK processing inhibitor BofA family protein [Bacillus sp. FJAT-50079]|uniref:pro-sigmaK processing inhibitor BofA family protein n=1 Tax=Bacillus sp. FJAT-50079 TaxID=2833577 RepID=UPI0020168DA8|nr:pro-sigmaK processing inhibitor BofA family protein [Bacillus sp. FJAT-50079]